MLPHYSFLRWSGLREKSERNLRNRSMRCRSTARASLSTVANEMAITRTKLVVCSILAAIMVWDQAGRGKTQFMMGF